MRAFLRAGGVEVGQRDLEGVVGGFKAWLRVRAGVGLDDLAQARAIGLDQLQPVEHIGQLRVPAHGDAHHRVAERDAAHEAADGSELHAVGVDADEAAGAKGVFAVDDEV